MAARHLVLDPERELDPCYSFFHDPIVFTVRRPPQVLTNARFSGSGDTRSHRGRLARAVVGSLLRPWYGEFSSVCSRSRRSRSRCTTSCTRRRRSSSSSRRSRSIPLAWLIGEATEHAAEHTGPGIGGFLNATFGNAPELIIALIAVNEGLTEVVRGSLTGSVVGNLLLVLGAALVAGGRGRLDRFSSFLSFGLIAFATLLFLIPSIPGWDGDPDTDELAQVSAAISSCSWSSTSA